MADVRSARWSGQDPKKQASLAIEQLRLALDELIDQGNVSGVEKVIADLSSTTGLAATALAPLVERAREEVNRKPVGFDPALREAAQQANCTFDSKHPYLTFGCVTLHEKKAGEWTLSILDGIPLEMMRTRRPDLVATRCLAHIEQIEHTLKRADSLAADLMTAWETLRVLALVQESVPANLLMILTAEGRNLKNLLVSANVPDRRTSLSRAEFGYLLAHMSHKGSVTADGHPVRLRFSGTDQLKAKSPANYIAVPDSHDPRRATGRRLVSTVSLSTE